MMPQAPLFGIKPLVGIKMICLQASNKRQMAVIYLQVLPCQVFPGIKRRPAGTMRLTRGDFWLVKIDANGAKVWDKTYGGNLVDSLTSVQQSKDGGYIVGGYSTSPASGDKSDNSHGLQDYWIIKLDADGNKVWDKTYGGTKVDRLGSVKQTSDGGYIVGGTSESGIGNEKRKASYGKSDYWILKINSTGSVEWDKTLGGNQVDLFCFCGAELLMADTLLPAVQILQFRDQVTKESWYIKYNFRFLDSKT